MSRKMSPEAQAEKVALAVKLAERYLWHGHDNAMPRWRLAWLMKMDDRSVRELLETARCAGVLVCNDQDGKGYYIAETEQEIARQYRRDKARFLSIAKRLKPFRAAMKEAGLPT